MVDFISSLARWIHIVAGVVWIGHLYFFNFVNAQFAPTMDGDTKKKVVPELMPRALYWFRWGAAFTWVTGVLLLLLVFYHGRIMFDLGGSWGGLTIATLVLILASPLIYDPLYKHVLTDPKAGFIGGLVLSTAMVFFMASVAHFSYRAYTIHLGALFGTLMAYNVWFQIWPAQQQIIRATKEGTPPDAKLVALAGLRSKHNTYMSVPLIFFMMNAHATWAASPLMISLMVLVGWGLVYWLYNHSKTVKGF